MLGASSRVGQRWHACWPAAMSVSAGCGQGRPLVFFTAGVFTGLKDGGVVDRIGLAAWRQRRRQQHQLGRRSARLPPCLVHIIERSSPFSGSDDAEAAGESLIHVVRCPKSGVNFFDLGDFDRQFQDAQQRASSSLADYRAVLSALPQLSGQQQVASSSLLHKQGRLLSGPNGSSVTVHPKGQPLMVAAVGSTSSSSGAAAAPAGLSALRHSSLSAGRSSSLMRAVQDESS